MPASLFPISYSSGVLKTELIEDRKDAELIDEIGREEDIQPIRIVCIPFDNQVLLEEIRILDNPESSSCR